VLQTDIEYLGLTSLKQIKNGDVGLAKNKQLCYLHDIDLRIVFRAPTQKYKTVDNKNYTTCGKYKAIRCRAQKFNAFFECFCVLILFSGANTVLLQLFQIILIK